MPAEVARFGQADVERLLTDPGIVRNRLKVESAITNARAFLRVQEEFGSFADYVWRFVDGETIHNEWRTMAEIPAKTAEAETLEPRSQEAGVPFRRPHYLLRSHAGDRHGERPHCRLLPVGGVEETRLTRQFVGVRAGTGGRKG